MAVQRMFWAQGSYTPLIPEAPEKSAEHLNGAPLHCTGKQCRRTTCKHITISSDNVSG